MRFFTPLRSVQNDMTEGGLSGNRIHSNVDMTTQPDFCIMRSSTGQILTVGSSSDQ